MELKLLDKNLKNNFAISEETTVVTHIVEDARVI